MRCTQAKDRGTGVVIRERMIDAALVVSIIFLAVALTGCHSGSRMDRDRHSPWCDLSMGLCER